MIEFFDSSPIAHDTINGRRKEENGLVINPVKSFQDQSNRLSYSFVLFVYSTKTSVTCIYILTVTAIRLLFYTPVIPSSSSSVILTNLIHKRCLFNDELQ